MSIVVGRVIRPPDLKLGNKNGDVDRVRVDDETGKWDLAGKSVVEGKPVERWAVIDFTSGIEGGELPLSTKNFIRNLRSQCKKLGIHTEDPLVKKCTAMSKFSSVTELQKLLSDVIEKARKKRQELQLILCVMAAKHRGYNDLKWVSETKIGVMTQCCLSSYANEGQERYLRNLCLKINAKLGGSNFELMEKLPCLEAEDHVMFVGADVNHPDAWSSKYPSIAAVVATVNWPAANRYAARVAPQNHRKENILKFGDMCKDLVNAYATLNNGVKPNKIVVFRDGVSESEFDMVLNKELTDMEEALFVDDYRPKITLVVAQKRHRTRLFIEDEGVGDTSGNVPPGTVVDTIIVHPFEFDFYLCSHYGSLGTSKPTHYYVLSDRNGFSCGQLQKLIYNLCYTFARCTQPVSLVPPVFYADRVAYRGRLFQEVIMKKFRSPASRGDVSFDENFYKLHPELQNSMFFI